MTHTEKNQLFIYSIDHWIVDGVEKFEDGLAIIKDRNDFFIAWNSGEKNRLNGS